jgi:hypothetical protein
MSTVVGVVGERGLCTGAGGGVEGVKPVRALFDQYCESRIRIAPQSEEQQRRGGWNVPSGHHVVRLARIRLRVASNIARKTSI